jgi:preprotein translocase subunit SecG
MYYIFLLFHLLAALVLILVVLLQSGKAGDLASTFGGTSSQTAFGARSAATVLTKATTVAAIVFMCTSLGLAIYYSKGTESTIMDTANPTTQSPQAAPQTPAATPETPAQQPAPAEGGSQQQETPPPDGGGGQ